MREEAQNVRPEHGRDPLEVLAQAIAPRWSTARPNDAPVCNPFATGPIGIGCQHPERPGEPKVHFP